MALFFVSIKQQAITTTSCTLVEEITFPDTPLSASTDFSGRGFFEIHSSMPRLTLLIEGTNWESLLTGDVNQALANWEAKYIE